MPELPEVQTTVNGLKRHVVGLTITEVWSDYNSSYFKGSQTIKDPDYFSYFKKQILGAKIISIHRRAKNILINLDCNQTILIHMKMTGHVLYGKYRFNPKAPRFKWEPLEPVGLKDPYNKHIHFMLSLNNGKNLALCDTRKFAKVTLFSTNDTDTSLHLKDIGPEPLEKSFDLNSFKQRLDLKPNSKIKQVLMDQTVLAGIGNIYADESLWLSGIHPLERVRNISSSKRAQLFRAVKNVLSHGIKFGGDSMSDYRNIHGEKGDFQNRHNAYRRTGKKCLKKGCKGIITRIVIGSRSAHFCPAHQKMQKVKS